MRLDGDPVQRAFELGCVLLAPSLHDTLGADRDLARLTELVATPDRSSMSAIFDETSRLVRDPVFVRRRMAVEHALYSRLSLSASEVGRLLA